MDLYTLTNTFHRDEYIDEFSSIIWTERYGKAGDVNLIVEPTPKNIATLKEGKFLQLAGSKEVMLLETALIEDGVLKVLGNTLDMFLNNRLFNLSEIWSEDHAFLGDPAGVGYIMSQLVELTCMPGSIITSDDSLRFGGPQQVITNLVMGPQDDTDAAVDLQISIPTGPVYDSLVQIAERYSLGFSLFLAGVIGAGYSLEFTTYRGADRTSSQTTNPVVRFSPNLDSLGNLKELRSIAGYKNVAYAFGPGMSGSTTLLPGVAYAYPAAEFATDFERRPMKVWVDDLQEDSPDATVRARLDQAAKDALANNNYTKVVDGEVIPQSEFTFGTHYFLGDIVELEGADEVLTKARITEYIRTKDNTGERAYPTVSVID